MRYFRGSFTLIGMRIPLLAIFLALPGLTPEGWAGVIHGTIHPSEADAPNTLFFYERTEEEKDGKTRIHSRYLDKAHTVLAEEICELNGGTITKYEYFQRQMKEDGRIEVRDGRVHYTYTAQGKTKTDDDEVEPRLLVSEMVSGYLRAHWQELMAGETIKARLLVVERLDTIGFKFFKDKERTENGKALVDFTMKPSSLFIDAIVPNFRLTLEKDPPHRTVETFGRLPIRVPEVPNPTKRKDYKAIDALLRLEGP